MNEIITHCRIPKNRNLKFDSLLFADEYVISVDSEDEF
jgi:hypothetical protein